MTRYLSIAFAAFSIFLISLFGHAMTVGPNDIQINAVRGKHIKKNNVKSSDIKNNTVKSKDIRDGTIQTKDLANEAVNAAKIESGAVGTAEIANGSITPEKFGQEVSGQFSDRDNKLGSIVDFYATIDTDGGEVTLAENGPLKIFARCTINGAGAKDKLEIFGLGTEPWYHDLSFDDGATPATEAVRMLETNFTTGIAYAQDSVDRFYMLADGYYIGVVAATTALALNVFGHVCTVSGTARLISEH